MKSAIIFNFLWFQLSWFAVVVLTSMGAPDTWLALVVAVHLAVHFHFFKATKAQDLKTVALVALTGVAMDMALTYLGIYVLPHSTPPLWLVGLWLMFPTTFHHSLRWLHGRTALSAAFAAIGGPLTYWSGEAFQLIHFGQPLWFAVLISAVSWAVYFPIVMWLTQPREKV